MKQLRLLAVFIPASVVLHVVTLLMLPLWQQSAPPVAPAVLDVVLLPSGNAPPVTAPPQRTSVRSAAIRSQASTPHVLAAAAVPARTDIAVPAMPAESTPAVADSAPAPVSAVAITPRAVPTPPAFNAAYLRNPPPRYPPAARRSGDQGTVLLRVLVSADGAPAQVELDRSSGSSLLDGAALDAVRGWRFVPARRGVQNVDDWVQVPVVFRLES